MSNSASTWTLDDFNNLGISYKETPDNLKFFLQIIEHKLEDYTYFDKDKILCLGETFGNFTDKYWPSSTDLNTDDVEQIETMLSIVDAAENLDDDLSNLRYEYDQIINHFLPTETELRKQTLEGFARYIEFHFPSISVLVVRECNG